MHKNTQLCTDTRSYEQTQLLTELLEAFCLFKLLGSQEEKQPVIFHQPGKKQSGWKGEILCEIELNSQDSPRISIVMGRSCFDTNR